ncbi:AAEL013371-PA [Aedes aegypti]|uniref:AAEL013371-PA n=1 Tax=Aedes aegypti TaxID=7159 RepID=Q16JD3_AEDAE|nr:AAEL013371-PA [Aedes aegypti]
MAVAEGNLNNLEVFQYHYGSAEESILEQGKLAVIGAIAKAKEIADRGISVKSERQQSYDIFGLKFGTNNGIETGFGDAATEKNLEKIEDDLFRRRKRSLAVLEALKAAGLFSTNSAVGTNVNIVKINSVSNVNNYGPTTTPEATTESAKRRRRLIGDSRNPTIYGELEEKVSYTSSDLQMDKNAKFQSHTKGGTQSKHLVQMEQNEIEGPIVRNRRSLDEKNDPEKVKLDDWIEDDTGKIFGAQRMKRALVLSKYENKISYFQSDSEAKSDGSTKTHTFTGSRESKLSKISEEPGLSRAKRSPQDMDSDVMPTDLPPQNGTGGPPRGPPPGEGGKGGGGGGRGRGGPGGPGRGKGRRPPCPPPSEENTEEASDGQRRKREVHQGNQSDSSYYSNSLSSEEGSRRRKREIDANADNGNGAVSDSSFYSDSLSSDSSGSSSEESDPNTGAEETTEDDSQRVKRSPCKGGSRPTTPAPGGMRRRKREAESQSAEVENVNEKVDQNLSFFTDVMEKFFKAVKKVADTAKQVFNGGRRDAEGSNPNAETI